MTASPEPRTGSSTKQGFASGISIVAAALLFVAGLVSLFQGISALADYIFEFDLTTWGWVHLVLGVIGILIAGGLAMGADWARVAAVVIASLSIVAQFLWLPYYPAWAILIIVLDLIVIWAVSTWNPDVTYRN